MLGPLPNKALTFRARLRLSCRPGRLQGPWKDLAAPLGRLPSSTSAPDVLAQLHLHASRASWRRGGAQAVHLAGCPLVDPEALRSRPSLSSPRTACFRSLTQDTPLKKERKHEKSSSRSLEPPHRSPWVLLPRPPLTPAQAGVRPSRVAVGGALPQADAALLCHAGSTRSSPPQPGRARSARSRLPGGISNGSASQLGPSACIERQRPDPAEQLRSPAFRSSHDAGAPLFPWPSTQSRTLRPLLDIPTEAGAVRPNSPRQARLKCLGNSCAELIDHYALRIMPAKLATFREMAVDRLEPDLLPEDELGEVHELPRLDPGHRRRCRPRAPWTPRCSGRSLAYSSGSWLMSVV